VKILFLAGFISLCGVWSASSATLVYLMAGQSNMAGYQSGLPSAPYDAPQDVKFWNYQNDGWIDLRPGLGDTANDIGPEVGFGYALKALHPDDDIYLVKWGVDSTSLAGPWNPNGSGAEYNTFKSRVNAALASLSGESPVVAGMIWMQGETDASNTATANAYAANLTTLINTVRSDFATPNMPFVLGRITDLSVYEGFPGVPQVRAAQETVPGQVGNAAWINTDDLAINPAAPGHYNAQGQIELGLRFANQLQAIPEPSAVVLGGLGVLAVMGSFWYKQNCRAH
jgi:hypothetical protein